MKREVRFLVALLLVVCICTGTAASETLYVKTDIESPLSLRDADSNEVLITIPAGTALEPDGTRSTDLFAYVTYNGCSGYVLWNYLTRTAPADAVRPESAPVTNPEKDAGSAAGPYSLKAVGAVIQRAAKRNKPTGEEMTETAVTAEDSFIVTAKAPKGKKIDYWVINGVKYDFLRNVKWMNITSFDRSWTIEVVYKNADPETLRSAEEIQSARTGATLIAEVKNGELCHIKSGTKGGGGWITSFDFTSDYTNRANEETEKGGQLTAKIRAKIPKGKKVAGWKLDMTEFYPATEVSDFVVRMLNTSMTYEPIFSGKAATPTPKVTATPSPKPKVTAEPEPEIIYYTVTCKNCSFSGGGYSGATSGKVPKGTKITVKAGYSEVGAWQVNGSTLDTYSTTITRTINSNTTIVCNGPIY